MYHQFKFRLDRLALRLESNIWAWLEMFFTPMKYQDPVLWAWLEMFFTPIKYQDPVLWAWLEMFLTPMNCQDPVLWAWFEMFFTLGGTNYSKTTHYFLLILAQYTKSYGKSFCRGPF